jgi:hypothetical protein
MAIPRLVSVREFNTSRFSQLADTSTSNVSEVIARAEKKIESQLMRPIYPTQITEIFKPTTSVVYLKHRPIVSIDSVGRGFSASGPFTATALYLINNDEGWIDFQASVVGYSVKIVYTAGYEETPEDLKEAILMQTALYIFQDLEIYGSGDSKEPGILYMNEDIRGILQPYQQLHTAYTNYR